MYFIVCVFFFYVFCLMIGQTFVMFYYANKEFEFEFEFVFIQVNLIGLHVWGPVVRLSNETCCTQARIYNSSKGTGQQADWFITPGWGRVGDWGNHWLNGTDWCE